MALNQRLRPPASEGWGWTTLAVAVAALLIAIYGVFRSAPSATQSAGYASAMTQIESSGTMRVGYGGFPPYTIVDPKEQDPNKRVSGFAADMVNEIAKRH